MGKLLTLQRTTCDGSTYYTGYTWYRTTCELGPLVSGLVVPLGPLMQGILETPGHTVAGNLAHGRVKVVPLQLTLHWATVECLNWQPSHFINIVGKDDRATTAWAGGGEEPIAARHSCRQVAPAWHLYFPPQFTYSLLCDNICGLQDILQQ